MTDSQNGQNRTKNFSVILQIPAFLNLVREKQRLKGKPVADPFVIASAREAKGSVVTEESAKPTGSRIPNVCSHFKISCVNLQLFMKNENWTF